MAKKYDLYELAAFGAKVTEIRWLEDVQLWQINTDRGNKMRARFVILRMVLCLGQNFTEKFFFGGDE